MLKKLLIYTFLLIAAPAFAQNVQQGGSVTRNHIPVWLNSGVIGDGGSSASSPITSIGVTNNGGQGFCINSASISSPGYNQLCLGAQTTGPALISLQNFGSATPQGIQFVVNGTAQGFPTVISLPVTVNDLACFAATNGTLKDCGNAGFPGASVISFGAKCDGSTDDSTAFTSAIAANNSIFVPAALTCIVHDVSIGANQILDCNGSALKAPTVTGANQWVVKKTGFNARIRNCQIIDISNATKHATTLNGGVSPGATTIVVTSATGMQINQAIVIALDSGAYWLTKITNISGTTITIADAIPSTQAVALTVTAGGTGYGTNDNIIVQGGIGPPITAHVTAQSGGIVSAVAVDAPGLYSTAPTSPAATMDATTQLASGLTLTLTAAGASSGNIVESTWGVLVVDNSSQGLVDNISFGSVPAGLHVLNSNGAGSGVGETYSNMTINAQQIFGIFKDVNVHDARFDNIIGFGTTHNASSYGVAGVYINGDSPGVIATGGNLFKSVNMLNTETAWLNNTGQLDEFTQTLGDTTRNYGFICNACNNNTWGGGTHMSFSGPNAITGTGKFGGGMYFGNTAINNVLEGLQTNNNAFDLHVADAASSIWLAGQAWAPSKNASGNTGSLRASTIFSSASATSVGGSGSTNYLGAAGFNSNVNVVAAVIPFNTTITQFQCASTAAPGAGQSYTCNLVDNTNILGSCSYSGASAFSCTYTGPGIFTFPNHQVAIQIVASASAAANQFRGYVVGF